MKYWNMASANSSSGQLLGTPFFSRLLSASMWFTNGPVTSYPNSYRVKSHNSYQHTPSKPPNILIYSGPNHTTVSRGTNFAVTSLNKISQTVQRNIFNNVYRLVSACMNKDAYVIYELTDSQALTSPWSENTALLINCCEHLSAHISEQFVKYFKEGGKLLSFGCAGLDSNFLKIETSLDLLDGEACLNFVQTEKKTISYPSSSRYQYICRYISYNSGANENKVSDNLLHVPFISKTYFYQDSLVKPSVAKLNIEKCSIADCKGVDVMAKVSCGDGVAIFTPVVPGCEWPMLADADKTVFDLQQSQLVHKQIMCNLLSKHMFISCDSHTSTMNPTDGTLYCQTQWEKSHILTTIREQFVDYTIKSKTLQFKVIDDTSPTHEDQVIPYDQLSIKVTSKFGCVEDGCWIDHDSFQPFYYFKSLSSKYLGKQLLHFDVITSTMDVCQLFQQTFPSLVVGANRQISGKGRSDNAWISPVGSLSMSVMFSVPLSSKLGQHLPFIQHIVALSAVLAIRNTKSCSNLDMNVKWPNDIYYKRDVKVGGVLVTSSICGNQATCIAGIGLNVSNSNPTTCINDILRDYNACTSQDVPLFTVDRLMARIVSELECLIQMFDSGHEDKVRQLYYKYWLHSNARVCLDTGEMVIIKGLDDNGFLTVQSEQASHNVYTVQPDGNSFDMLHNLIRIKPK